jgi:hypothetical protein
VNVEKGRVTPTPIAEANGAVRLVWLGAGDLAVFLGRSDMEEEVIW